MHLLTCCFRALAAGCVLLIHVLCYPRGDQETCKLLHLLLRGKD